MRSLLIITVDALIDMFYMQLTSFFQYKNHMSTTQGEFN